MTTIDPSARVGTRNDRRSNAPAFGQGDPATRVPIRARQALAVVALLAVAITGIVWCIASGTPSSSARPDVFGGSLVVPFAGRDPIVVDLATSRATVRLQNLKQVVSAQDINQVQMVPTDIGTFLVNTTTGTYNMLDRNNVVVLRTGGVDLPVGVDPAATVQPLATTGGIYIIRRSPNGAEVFLIDRDTVSRGSTDKNIARGYVALDAPVSGDLAAAVVVRDALWLVGRVRGEGAELLRLSLRTDPERRDLQVDSFGSLEAEAVVSGGPDGTVVAASPGVGRLLVAGTGAASSPPAAEVASAATKESRAIVPVQGDREGTWLATRGGDGGWALVRVSGDGQVADPIAIGDSRPIERMRPPLVHEGRAWVVSGDDGTIRRVDLDRRETDRPAGADRYPVLADENPGADFFADAVLTARGPRVVVNAPNGVRALVISDGGDEVTVVNKSTVLDFDPTASPSPQVEAGAAAAATAGGAQPRPTEPAAAKDQISETASCENLSQVPRKPQLVALEPTKDTMVVRWVYNKLDPGDCQPSSYLVEARGRDGADDPVSPVQAHATAETQFVFGGLRPNRTYEFRVTAVIGTNRTVSEPMQRRTDETGPDPARSVSTSADQPGGWSVSWTACRGNECDMPAAAWEVSWQLCAGGIIGEQATLTDLPSDQREVDIGLANRPDLVGKSLTFTVTAVSAKGQRASLGDGRCTEGWRKPNGRAVILQATGKIEDDGSVTIHATVENTPERTAAFGGSSPTFVFSTGNVRVETKDLAADLRGLAPGTSHQVTVTVSTHGQSDPVAPVTVDPLYKGWPSMRAKLAIERIRTNRARVTITVDGAPTDATVIAEPELNCGGGRNPGGPRAALQNNQLSWEADLVYDLGPSCGGSVKLQENDHPIFSGQVDLDLNTVTLEGLTPPAIDLRWDVEYHHFRTRTFLRISGTIPEEGAEWRIVPTRNTGFCLAGDYRVNAGPLPGNTALEDECVNESNEVILRWKYLNSVKEEVYRVAGPRPTPTQPSTTTTTRATTTTTDAATTTTRPATTTTRPTTTTTAGLGVALDSPLSLLLVVLASFALVTGVRRVRLRGTTPHHPPSRRGR